MTDIEAAVEAFWNASGSHGMPPEWADRLTADQGFQVQIAIQQRYDELGDERIGWKVAATNPAVQQQLGLSEPGFGSLRKSRKCLAGAAVDISGLIQPHAECELCFELNHRITETTSAADVILAIDACYPAFEIIEKRVPMSQLGAAMADNAECSAVVLGSPFEATTVKAYDEVMCRLSVNGLQKGSGAGKSVLGNPLNSIFWLKQRLAAFGLSLSPGSLIMTGSFMRQHPITAGDHLTADFSNGAQVNFVAAGKAAADST